MKLDMDLLRALLLYVEENADEPISNLTGISLEEWADKQVAYHVMIAEEAGLISALIDTRPDDEDPRLLRVFYSVHRLTFDGHELLGSIREPKHWQVIKRGLKSAGVASLGALGSYVQAYARAEISKRFGVDIG